MLEVLKSFCGCVYYLLNHSILEIESPDLMCSSLQPTVPLNFVQVTDILLTERGNLML